MKEAYRGVRQLRIGFRSRHKQKTTVKTFETVNLRGALWLETIPIL